MRRAIQRDIPLLVGLMAEFYREAGYELDRGRAAIAFATLIDADQLGYIWILQNDGQDVGHLVITVRYAMEYGGLIAYLDDLYVGAAWRNKGVSTAALREVCRFCEGKGIRALTVQVDPNNRPAQKVYRRLGFGEAADRQLLTLALAAPAHLV